MSRARRPIIHWAVCCAVVLAGLVGCRTSSVEPDQTPVQSEEAMTTDELPVCASHSDIERLDGQRVAVVGTYEQVDVRKRRPGADMDPVYRGHVVLRFDDGHAVFLEPTWSDDAIRPDDEIDELEGRKARAVGVLHEYCPTPEQPVAAIISPCLTPVDEISAAE